MAAAISVSVDTHRAQTLLAEVEKVSATRFRGVIELSAGDLKDAWVRNATVTAGAHGKWYPDSIESHMVFGGFSVLAEVGPNPQMRQGAMSFEFGSVNQPPHLDGRRALDEIMPSLRARLDTLAGL